MSGIVGHTMYAVLAEAKLRTRHPGVAALCKRQWSSYLLQDAIDLYPAGESKLAYLFGWLVHIVGDSMIKSVRPGLKMTLLDGLYTSRNRPVQDLVTYHEIGRKELGLDWAKGASNLLD